MRDDEKDEWMDVFVFWSKANIMATTSVYFFLSWVRGKPSFLHMTVAEESPSTSQGKTASWPIFAVTIELPSFMTGGTGEKSQTLYVEIFLKCILNQLVMDSLTYRESPLWKTDWCFQRCWWPHSCTDRCPQAWLPVSRGTDPLPASVYDLPAERIEERCVSQFFSFCLKPVLDFFLVCTWSLDSSLYHSISGAGSLSARHSKVRCPLTGTVSVLTSPEPRRVGGTETQPLIIKWWTSQTRVAKSFHRWHTRHH